MLHMPPELFALYS